MLYEDKSVPSNVIEIGFYRNSNMPVVRCDIIKIYIKTWRQPSWSISCWKLTLETQIHGGSSDTHFPPPVLQI
jgi:hypothetical protein